MGYRGMGELPNPMNQLAQVSQIQAAQRQGEVSQMQLEDLKNDRIEMQKFQAELVANGGNPDLRALAQTMLRSPKTRAEGMEFLRKLEEQDKFAVVGKKLYPELFGAEPTAEPIAAPTAAPAPSIMRQPGVAPAVPVAPNALGTGMYGMEPTAPANALAPTTAPAAAPVNALAAPAGKTADQLRGEIIMFSQSTDPRAKAMVDMLKAQLTEASKTAPDAVLMQKLGYPLTQAGYQAFRDAQRQERMLSPAEEEQRIRIANASRAPATPAQPSAPVAVVGEDGKIIYVSREDAINKGMTPASAIESLSPKEIQKREAVLPQATSAIKGFETKSNSFVNDLVKLRDHPGLSEITGFVAGRAPGITGAGRAAQALYDKVVAKGGFQALQDLRDASKTGGALGNVSDREGKQLTASAAAIDRRQNADDVKASIDQFIGDIQGASTRMREAYDSTYSYKTSAPAAAAGPNIDALLNKYK
jgi:hypothetical protein